MVGIWCNVSPLKVLSCNYHKWSKWMAGYERVRLWKITTNGSLKSHKNIVHKVKSSEGKRDDGLVAKVFTPRK